MQGNTGKARGVGFGKDCRCCGVHGEAKSMLGASESGSGSERKKRKPNKNARQSLSDVGAMTAKNEISVIPASDGEEEDAMLPKHDRVSPSLPTLSSGSPRSLSPVSDSDSEDEAVSLRLLVSASQAVPQRQNIDDEENYEMEQDDTDDLGPKEKMLLQSKVAKMEAQESFKHP